MIQWARPVLASAAALSLAMLIQPAVAQVNLLENGDFEDLAGWGAVGDAVDAAPAGWRDSLTGRFNAAAQQSGANAIGGAGTSAFLPADAGVPTADRKDIVQIGGVQTGPVYRYEFDFAVEDAGGAGDRSLSFSTRDGNDNGLTISMRVNGDGDLDRYSGSWGTLLPGAVVFDDDVSVTPLVHHFSLTIDTTGAPFYDVQIIDSNGVVHSASGLTDFRGTPALGEGGTGIEFNTFISSGDALIDNVSLVPEPATATLATLGCIALLAVIRRRK